MLRLIDDTEVPVAPARQPQQVVVQIAAARYVLPEIAALATGYTVKAMMRKIETGVWVEGAEWVKAPDGRRLIDLRGYERWAAAGRGSR
jgi:hypothetical protein